MTGCAAAVAAPGVYGTGANMAVTWRKAGALGLAGFAAACAASLAFAAAQSAPPTQPVFRISSDLVVIDLVPTDAEGRFVDDLAPGEIQVVEDGTPRRVQFVRLVRSTRHGPGEAGEPRPAGTGEAAVARREDPVGVDGGPLSLAIVIDLQGTPADALPRTRAAIASMVKNEIPAGTRLLLATIWHGVVVRVPFSDDRSAFLAALDQLPAAAGEGSRLLDLLDKAEQACETPDGLPAAISFGKAVIIEATQDLRAASDGLGALARMLASISGRKHVVVYSAGYAINPTNAVIDAIASVCSGTDARGRVNEDDVRRRVAADIQPMQSSDATEVLAALIDQANRAQVSFYTINALGLQIDSLRASERGSPRLARRGQQPAFSRLAVTMPQEYLRSIAGDTGGRAFINTNDLGRGLRRAWVDASEYYMVGYVPADDRKKPGRFHRIEVKVARAGLDLRYRQGYRAASEQDLADRDLLNAMRFPGLFDNGDLEVEAGVGAGKLRVVAYVRPAALSFTETQGRHRCEITLQAFLRDAAGRIVDGKALFSKNVTLSLPADRLKVLQQSDNVAISTEVTPPGRGAYQLTVIARHGGARLVTRSVPLSVE